LCDIICIRATRIRIKREIKRLGNGFTKIDLCSFIFDKVAIFRSQFYFVFASRRIGFLDKDNLETLFEFNRNILPANDTYLTKIGGDGTRADKALPTFLQGIFCFEGFDFG